MLDPTCLLLGLVLQVGGLQNGFGLVIVSRYSSWPERDAFEGDRGFLGWLNSSFDVEDGTEWML
jgi:hypothetical protein